MRRPPQHVGLRCAGALSLFLFAAIWPLVDIGPKGSTIVRLTARHGIDSRDFFAIVPLLFGMALIWPVLTEWWQRLRERP